LGRRTSPRYEIIYEHTTDWLRKRRYAVRARNVVVAGGVLGTVDLLLRCRDETGSLPLLSQHVGKSCAATARR
jgi:cholesterol oxidase